MILVSLQASFVGDAMDGVDKANVLAFGDPMVNLTGGTFVDNTNYSANPATALVQGITFRTSNTGVASNQVTINFVSVGAADASAISVSGDAVTVDITTALSATRTTAQIKTLFDNFPPSTTHGGVTVATGGSATPATTTANPVDFMGGSAAFTASFSFKFPASDLHVGVTTQMQGYTARFMTQLPPPPLGIPTATAGPLDCVTSDPQHAAQYWITTVEARISDLMTQLRQKTPLGPQPDATV
jgi:hypothetical protein